MVRVCSAIPGPLTRALCPAATIIILPVVCVLQTEADEVLPSIDIDLTLSGSTAPKLESETGILLRTKSGVAFEPTEPALCTRKAVVPEGLFEPESIAKFVARFRSVRLNFVVGILVTPLVPIAFIEFVTAFPPSILQVIIIILLITRVLGITLTPRAPAEVAIPRCLLPTFKQATSSAVLPLAILTEQPLLKLATMLPLGPLNR